MRTIRLLPCALLLAVAACSVGATPTPTPTPTPIPYATSTAAAGPMPITAVLAPPSQNCAITPPPHELTLAQLGDNSNVQLVGGGPFWFYGGFYQSVLHLGPTGYHEWPQWKWVVEVGPNYTQPVTLDLWNLDTRALAWWSVTPPQPATQSLVLDPALDTGDVGPVPWLAAVPHGGSAPGWKEWGIFPLFSVAGCYALEASWAGGSWRSVMAVGN
jgi:hypothetical protein